MSPDARLMCGLSLILIPTIVYGGLTVLWVISNGTLGTTGPPHLSGTQANYYRAGHAHAGVLTLLALLLQVLIDHAALPTSLIWPARIGAFVGPLLVSGGFFAVAHLRAMRGVLYLGALVVALTTLAVGIGLLRPA